MCGRTRVTARYHHHRRLLQNKRGVVLILSYLFISVLLIMNSAYLSRMAHDQRHGALHASRVKGVHFADAGLDEALVRLAANASYVGTGGPVTLGDGAYDITVAAHPQDPDLRLATVIGYHPDPSVVGPAARQQRIDAVVSVQTALFQYALSTVEKFVVTGDVIVDSYDSEAEPPLFGRPLGHISSNDAEECTFDIRGTLRLTGADIVLGPESPPEALCVSGFADYDELIVPDDPVPYPPITVPELAERGPIPAPVDKVIDLAPGKYEGALDIGKGVTVQLHAGDYDFETIRGREDSQILGDTAGLINVYVTTADISQGVRLEGTYISNSEQPTQLGFYIPTGKFRTLGGDSTIYATVYVPNGSYGTRGDVTHLGAVMALEIVAYDDLVFHYDEAIRTTIGAGSAEIKVWKRDR